MNAIEMNQYYITGAYAVMWVMLLGYTARLVRKASRVRNELERVSRADGANR